jgi:DNA-binding Xre family transcriptional regulator
MGKITLGQLGSLTRDKRGKTGIRDAAKQVGVSAATLSRIEAGKLPDLDTFSKLCKWLNINPAEILGYRNETAHAGAVSTTRVHFRAEKTMSTETAKHLGQLILAVQRAVLDEQE